MDKTRRRGREIQARSKPQKVQNTLVPVDMEEDQVGYTVEDLPNTPTPFESPLLRENITTPKQQFTTKRSGTSARPTTPDTPPSHADIAVAQTPQKSVGKNAQLRALHAQTRQPSFRDISGASRPTIHYASSTSPQHHQHQSTMPPTSTSNRFSMALSNSSNTNNLYHNSGGDGIYGNYQDITPPLMRESSSTSTESMGLTGDSGSLRRSLKIERRDSTSVLTRFPSVERPFIPAYRQPSYLSSSSSMDNITRTQDLMMMMGVEPTPSKPTNLTVNFNPFSPSADVSSFSNMLVADDSKLNTYMRWFQPEEELGGGSYGKVDRAFHRKDGWSYAIKKIPVRNKQAEKAAMNEVYIMTYISHPNIVRYHSSWAEDNIVFIQMEYCQKGSLSKWWKQLLNTDLKLPMSVTNQSSMVITATSTTSPTNSIAKRNSLENGQSNNSSSASNMDSVIGFGPIKPFEDERYMKEFAERVESMMCEIMRQCCKALKYLHEEKFIVHLDIKPDNIFVQQERLDKPVLFKLGDCGSMFHFTPTTPSQNVVNPNTAQTPSFSNTSMHMNSSVSSGTPAASPYHQARTFNMSQEGKFVASPDSLRSAQLIDSPSPPPHCPTTPPVPLDEQPLPQTPVFVHPRHNHTSHQPVPLFLNSSLNSSTSPISFNGNSNDNSKGVAAPIASKPNSGNHGLIIQQQQPSTPTFANNHSNPNSNNNSNNTLTSQSSHTMDGDDLPEGDPRYLAPELLNCEVDVDLLQKADIYALGCSIVELVADAMSHERRKMGDAERRRQKWFEFTLPDQLSPEFRSLIQSLLEHDPTHRPSASDLLKHELLLTGEAKQERQRIKLLEARIAELEEMNHEMNFSMIQQQQTIQQQHQQISNFIMSQPPSFYGGGFGNAGSQKSQFSTTTNSNFSTTPIHSSSPSSMINFSASNSSSASSTPNSTLRSKRPTSPRMSAVVQSTEKASTSSQSSNSGNSQSPWFFSSRHFAYSDSGSNMSGFENNQNNGNASPSTMVTSPTKPVNHRHQQQYLQNNQNGQSTMSSHQAQIANNMDTNGFSNSGTSSNFFQIQQQQQSFGFHRSNTNWR